MKIKLSNENDTSGEWHTIFSWLPRIIEDRWMKPHFVWLEHIERKYTYWGFGYGYVADYRVKDE